MTILADTGTNRAEAVGVDIVRGRYRARSAQSDGDLAAVQVLRSLCFGRVAPRDVDDLDPFCVHVLIQCRDGGDLVGCFRMLALTAADLPRSYAAQFYDLSALGHFKGPMLEMGRFCIDPARKDPDIVRLAWSALTAHVDGAGVRMLFGCSSFQGVDPGRYPAAFALLRERHLAPCRWAPRLKAAETFAFAAETSAGSMQRAAVLQVPPLLRSYLSMGAWVSDHAVIDRAMNTLHVFTGLEVDAIPARRKQLLRAL